MNVLDSNSPTTKIHQVCAECGIAANVLTCLKKFGQRPKQLCFEVSTYHRGMCDNCQEFKEVTETRDFFYPDFSLLVPVAGFLRKNFISEKAMPALDMNIHLCERPGKPRLHDSKKKTPPKSFLKDV